MSNKKKVEETRTSIDDINDSLTSIGAKARANMKKIGVFCVVIAVVFAGIFAYMYLVRKPAIANSNNAIGDADREMLMGNDSIATMLYMDAADKGHNGGNRAKLMAAINLYEDGKYEEALNYISGYSAKDDVIGAAAYSLKGDCYVNLDQLPEAAEAFRKAVKQSNNNPYYTPFFLLKLARVYHAMGDNANEVKTYEEIVNEYPTYAQTNGVNVEKYLKRAQLESAN